MVVVLSSYSTASHAKGRFFVLLSREKISSNHDTSVLIVFIFSHNMALFLLSFFLFFVVPQPLLLSPSSSETVWLQRATNLRGHFLKIGPHMQVLTIIKPCLAPCPLFGFPYNLLYVSIYSLTYKDWPFHNLKSDIGPDHVQVFWKHKSIGNQDYDWLTR